MSPNISRISANRSGAEGPRSNSSAEVSSYIGREAQMGKHENFRPPSAHPIARETLAAKPARSPFAQSRYQKNSFARGSFRRSRFPLPIVLLRHATPPTFHMVWRSVPISLWPSFFPTVAFALPEQSEPRLLRAPPLLPPANTRNRLFCVFLISGEAFAFSGENFPKQREDG